MASNRSWCSVLGCNNEHSSHFDVPKSEPLETQWLSFVFKGNISPDQRQCFHVCANHFSPDCFINEAGFAKKLLLKKGSVLTIRVPAAPPEEVRTTMLYPDIGVGPSIPLLSSTPIKRPNKRSRLELEEEEEDPSGASSMTRLLFLLMLQSPVHKTATYIVYENCLLQLFEQCSVCQHVTKVRRTVFGTLLSVEQRCPHCDFFRKWNSQPIIQSTPAGNLQLSVAVYANGASFFRVKQAMKLKMIHYTTFRIHARRYIQPAIVHSWKTAQDGMLQQLRQQQNIVLGGDTRYLMLNNCLSLHITVKAKHTYLREDNITQYYDVWHIENGIISKKLLRIAQNKDSEKLQKWYRSIKKHIYCTAASSSSGPERVAKWVSILNQIQNMHTHDDPIFPRFLHLQRTTTDKSKWLSAGVFILIT
uniref:THAP-type domain-containing protein n=1 Tax=Cyprinus carpio TaxID=7962 RepID=A0A8C1LJG1_CYPCA